MGARAALRGPGRAGAVVRSLGPGDMRIVEMSCESGRWGKVARLESGVRGTVMSCQLGRETRGTVLEAASEVGLALSSAASVWSSVGAAREHFLLESGVRGTMMSCQLGRETRGTVLEAASEVGLALSSAASV